MDFVVSVLLCDIPTVCLICKIISANRWAHCMDILIFIYSFGVKILLQTPKAQAVEPSSILVRLSFSK